MTRNRRLASLVLHNAAEFLRVDADGCDTTGIARTDEEAEFFREALRELANALAEKPVNVVFAIERWLDHHIY